MNRPPPCCVLGGSVVGTISSTVRDDAWSPSAPRHILEHVFASRTPLASTASLDAVEDVLQEIEQLPVGPELAMSLAELPGPTAAGWNEPHVQVRLAARWASVATWAEGESLARIGAGAATVASSELPVDAINYATDLAMATQSGEGWADRQVDLGRQLTTRLPVIGGVLRCGMLTPGHARALARVLDAVDDDVARQIDERLTPRAVDHRWTPGELAAAARRMLLRLDPDGGAARHERALDREAGVTGGPATDGMAWLSATGDAVTVSDILDAVDARAEQLRQLVPDTPAGRARFAALGDLVLGAGFTLFDHVLGVETPDSPRDGAAQIEPEPAPGVPGATPLTSPRRRRRREVIVTIDLPTLLSLRDDPAQLAGFGPIPARLARLVAADATLRRMVTDPVDGETLDLGRRSYAPTDTLVTAIRARDRHCRFPGCRRARRPQLDHRIDHAVGGSTSAGNLHLLCERHHALKTAGLWKPELEPDGTVVWTGPDGQRAVRCPDRSAGSADTG